MGGGLALRPPPGQDRAMVLFVILAGLLTLAAAFWLARPLLRPMEAPPGTAEHDQEVYRDQLAELERDVARGVLSEEEAAAVRAEIGRRVLASSRRAAPERRGAAVPPARIAAVVAVLAPLVAIGLYMIVGRPGAEDQPLAARVAAGETAQGAADAELAAALAALSDDVRRNPDNFETRLMLARALFRTGQYEASLEHYARAAELTDPANNVEVLSEYGQARVMAVGGVDEVAFDLFRQVLEADPGNPEARFWLGAAMAQYGEYDLARQMWENLLADSPPDAPWVPVVRDQLAILEAQAAIDADAGDDAGAPETPEAQQ